MIPDFMQGRLSAPVIGAPMFIVSGPALVIAQCKAGIVGAFPALNARPAARLDEWICEIEEALAAHDRDHPDRPAAPYAVNQIVHRSNERLEQDLAVCERRRVPLVISSLGARPDVNRAVQGWGGITLHDVITLTHARKAIEKGANGLIAVAAGAGGHAGQLSPFALVAEIREWFDGPLALSGAIATGRAVRAAELIGADFAYVGSPFIATHEAQAQEAYKRMIAECSAGDVALTSWFTGIRGNYLKPSIRAAGLDPDALPEADPTKMSFEEGEGKKAWRDIWGSGQGIGAVKDVIPAAERADRLARDYRAALRSEPRLRLRPA